MQRIREMAAVESLVQRHSEENHLARQSVQSLPEGTGLEFSELMDQLQGRYPNQELGPVTVEMYLAEWEQIALRYGLAMLRRALSKLSAESRFFPDPVDIRETCAVIRRADCQREEAGRHGREVLKWKEEWERERREA